MVKCLQVYTTGKCYGMHSYLTFWFTGNGLAPTTNKYCDFNATHMCSVTDGKKQLEMSKIKDKI